MLRRNFFKTAGVVSAIPFTAQISHAADSNAGLAQPHGFKKIGLIGGIGPESTIPYYREIVYGVQKKADRLVFPKLTVESLNVFDVLRLSEAKDYDNLVKYLMVGINNLVNSNVDAVAMTGNTPHVVLDRLQAQCPVPIISIVQTTCDKAAREGLKKVALLGTISTMKARFFLEPFEKAGIEVIVPNDPEKEYINEKIGKELELGVVKPETREEFLKIIRRLEEEEKAEAIILGCTELPLLFEGQNTPFNCLDTMRIHIDALIDFIVSEAA